ncbi:putative cytochrome P450 [Microdochium trichocladiopsis]|uniref:Cytochrome P450 n=1 Tax=Microdochium trichocladiopsis TaxID=1682393 RepID=A0A9P8XS53_9PEZI|nr:putative cytochrome P450 [Microdochium trichocladiopsis]KAH7014215.1 putative cytochrome P450 [Microdochium trichocladiopsis]
MIVDLASDIRVWLAVAVASAAYLLRPSKAPFPVINEYPGDYFNKRALKEAQDNVRSLIEHGFARYPDKPFAIKVPYGYKIILPASLANWVKSKRELDHVQLVRDEYFAGLPGFESQTVLHHPDEYVKRMITTKLGQNDSTMPALNTALAAAIDDLWGPSQDWHMLNWHADTMGIIARAASTVFVGPEKSSDPEWLSLVQDYVLSYFGAVGDLHKYPVWSRRIVNWFLPNASRCRRLQVQARVIIEDVLSKRRAAVNKAQVEGKQPPVYNDALEWGQKDPECKHHPADMQLALAMAAMFTTSEMFRQILIDVARHPELVQPLRDEVKQKLSTHGVTVAATSNMVLLDSVMKESQRLSAPPAVVERAVLKDTALPDGRVLPHGSHLLVDATHLGSKDVYPDPEEFDGYRFLHKREAGDKSSSFVQSSPDFLVFGAGRHICPGRFFAANELKLALAHILLKYDIRHAEGSGDGKPWSSGFFAVVNPLVKVEVKRRADDGAAEFLA